MTMFGFIFPILWLVGAILPARRLRWSSSPARTVQALGGRIRNAVNPATRLACAVPVGQLRAAQIHSGRQAGHTEARPGWKRTVGTI